MHSYLVDMLSCPVCHGHLEWRILEQHGDRIESGSARCKTCDALYPVREGIGVFLPPDQHTDDMWEQTSRQVQYVLDRPEVEDALLHSPLESLNPSDQFFRGRVLEARGEYAAAKEAERQAHKGLYSAASRDNQHAQFRYVIEHLPPDGPVVDLASGRCYLAEEILRATERPVVATDWDLSLLRRDRCYLEFWGLYDRASLLAFDARRTPFRDGAVTTMTSFVGLSSIREVGDLLQELRRVVSGTLLAISAFISEGDEVHAPLIRQAGMETMLFRAKALTAFEEAGWQASIENARSSVMRPTPEGILVKGFRPDAFPVVETEQELCVIAAR